MGQAGFVIISCIIGAGEANAASTFLETIEKLDVAGQLMSKALKYGGKGVALMLKVPTKSVCPRGYITITCLHKSAGW